MTATSTYLNARQVGLAMELSANPGVLSMTCRSAVSALASIALQHPVLAKAVPSSPTTAGKILEVSQHMSQLTPQGKLAHGWRCLNGFANVWDETSARAYAWILRQLAIDSVWRDVHEDTSMDAIRLIASAMGPTDITEDPNPKGRPRRRGFKQHQPTPSPAVDPAVYHAPAVYVPPDVPVQVTVTGLTPPTVAVDPAPDPGDPFAGVVAALGQAKAIAAENMALKGANRILEEQASNLRAALSSAEKELVAEKAKPSATVAQATAPAVPPGEPTMDLDVVARACNVTRATVDTWISDFHGRYRRPLDPAIQWPSWANPKVAWCRLGVAWTNRTPFIATGPSGTGKTYALANWCRYHTGGALVLSCNRDMTESKLLGQMVVQAGETATLLRDLAMAVLTQTPVIVDEVDHMDLALQSLLHGLMDHYSMPLLSANLSIPASRHFPVLLGTCNSMSDDSGKYHGEVATALANRFAAGQYVEYPIAADEIKMVMAQTGCDKVTAEIMVGMSHHLRAAEANDGRINGPFSIRGSVNAARYADTMIKLGGSRKQALVDACESTWICKRPVAEQLAMREIITQTTGNDFLATVGGVP